MAKIEVSKPQADIIHSLQPYNLFLAGVGSGKSHTMGIISANFVCNFPHVRGLISANTYPQLTRSTLDRIYKVWSVYFGLKEGIHYVVDKRPPDHFKIYGEKLKDYKNTISFVNGALIWLASLENYKAIDGMEVCYALLDETKDSREESITEVVIARLRQPGVWVSEDGKFFLEKPKNIKTKGYNPLFVFTSPAKVQWLNNLFEINLNLEEILKVIFSKTEYYSNVHSGSKRVVISSTFHNEHNLPPDYIQSRIEIWKDTPGLVDMLVYGSPMAKSGGEWYSRYEREKHVFDNLEFDPRYPLHISFDFNVNPYMPALVMQIIPEGKEKLIVRVLKEYALKYPNNTTADVCDEIILDYAGLTRSIYYYGDASGKNRTTSTIDKSIRHNYDVIRSKLGPFLFEGSNKVPRSNPPIAGRRTLMNRLFSNNANIAIEVDSSCIEFINDLEYLKEDGNGGYLKPKKKDKATGISFEKLGHLSDSFVYFCYQQFNYIINFE